ncbi:M6 family metalloprotease domain-containing protein [Piscinibacter sp. XHJ-5]|uniref:M6 family metalloprotease domain-containing protein n=1 Tax=Piscinibacter sp. XHJ-5 TaxID=3037797 RepID=UPI00245298FB|nr:M6 family metalloprotease domain-containing protein [Piscinibacter sp. XHJ-5]
MATPFAGKTFTFTQPDGTRIQLRGWGDQHYAVFETLDGFTVVKNPHTGFYEIAQLSPDGTTLEPAPGTPGHLDGTRAAVQPGLRVARESARARGREGVMRLGGRRCDQRREERKTQQRVMRSLVAGGAPAFAPPQRGTLGDFVGLCLLIEFPDEAGAISRGEVENFCNQPGYSGFGNNGSVFDYYLANSIGRVRYTNVVAPSYRAQHPKAHYTDPAIPQGTRARQLILEAIDHLKATGFDFSALTADNAGMVYAMNVYYAGEVVNNWAEGLWPHAWHLETPVLVAPGKSVFDYQFTDMSQQLSLGTFCHENGHMLCDYPDLYDYGSESSGIGAYCLMCAGANIDEKNPTHICGYLKRLSGWAGSVKALEHGQQVSLPAGNNDFAMLAKDSKEYFLIENRVRSGRDASLPDEGLAIWHVDEEGDNSNEQMTPAKHYEVSLEQADGAFALETRRAQYGDATDLFGQAQMRFADTTTPDSKWWNGTTSHLDIHDISAPGPVVTFGVRLSEDVSAPVVLRRESSADRNIPDDDATGIVDTIDIAEALTITGLKVMVDITHTYRGDLRIMLTAPWGDAVVLHPKNEGGNADNLQATYDETALPALAAWRGRSTQGAWRLGVQDLAPADAGMLNRWALEFNSAAVSPGPVVLEEAPGALIPDNQPAGIERALATAAAGQVGSLEVSVDITHPWIGDLRVALRSPAGGEVVLHSGTGGSTDNLVQTYTVATTPGLTTLAGQPVAGNWTLSVADTAPDDVGKLNAWRVVVKPAVA